MMRVLAIGVLAVTAMSCGGGSDSGSCGKVEPCGGSVVGTWKAAVGCAGGFATVIHDACPTATVSATTATQSGTVTFNADLIYSVSVTTQFNFNYDLPPACNPDGISCAELGATAQSGSPAGSQVTCTGTDTCTCRGSITEDDTDTGTYSTAGTVITTVSDADGSSSDQTYCVQGNTLHFVDVDSATNMGPMGQATIVDDATYTKQ